MARRALPLQWIHEQRSWRTGWHDHLQRLRHQIDRDRRLTAWFGIDMDIALAARHDADAPAARLNQFRIGRAQAQNNAQDVAQRLKETVALENADIQNA